MVTQQARRGLTLALGLGFGIGLMAGAVLWSAGRTPALTDDQVVARARTLGMTRATELPGAKVSLVVGPETTLADLAAMLKASGTVADTEAFKAKAQAKHPNGKPRPGVQVITAGEPVDQLVDQLIAD